ncbi:MAG: Na+dependent transporter [Clostridiales bacterium GWB2_37_7]|nr:MAG: Na+dependent transporter [Clostridiales bacterium GWB2_37_7]
MAEKRENWGSKLGLILAMAGNAVGLGNFWRYPYQAAKNGGGAFMIPYFGALILMGIPLMFVEWNLGRYGGKYGHGSLGPMVYLQAREGVSPKMAAILGGLAGAIALGVTVLVNSYYNHIIGWTFGYAFMSVTGGYMDAAKSTGEVFVNYIQSPGLVFTFWLLALVVLGFAVSGGIQKGIELLAKFMMPTIYIFGIILIIRTLTLGSPVNPDWSPIAGLNYIWSPRWDQLSWTAALAAAGQIFFTLSLGMGIICNYASYLKPDDDIVLSGITTIALNEVAEVILGGTIAIPIAYTFLGEAGLGAGVGLSFISLPNIFRTMAGGQLMGTLWFLLLAFAGVTSAVAMYNYVVSLLEESFGFAKKKAALAVFLLYVVVGLPVALEPILTKTADLAYFTEVDNWVGSYLLVVLGLIEVIAAGWIMGGKAKDEMNRGSYWKVPDWFFKVFIQFLTPISIIGLLVMSTRDYIKAGYFKLVPSFVANSPQLIPWVQAARFVVFGVLAIGFFQAYKTIRDKYGVELESNQVSIRK